MRRILVLGIVAAAGLVVAGLTLAQPSSPGLTGACAKANLNLIEDGQLTLATDALSFPPWWGGKEKKGSGFSPSNPYTGKGYEGAVAYTVATRLGFTRAEVTWKAITFTKSFAPGKKPFDFYLSQVSYNPVRAKAVSFSRSYYDVNQAVVAIKGTAITKAKSLRALKPFTFGAPVGTTSYDYIVKFIKPSKKPKVYDSVNDAVTALKNKQIDGLVVDFPSTGYITGVQVPNSTVVGRLPNQGKQEYLGLVFQRGNSLVSCANKVLASMRKDGTLKRLERRWLAGAGGAPLLKK